ncbi:MULTISPECIES: FecR family protein [unclassified Sphingomonas]|uniref:FecR family protein n=1 Tax=unclassified Sphingomonas TaxID=196159 RepID=UPI00082979F3|nr:MULTISPECIES: FecR domain-containing protein [unclassified Sphingomonas]
MRAEQWARDYAATPELRALRDETLARVGRAREVSPGARHRWRPIVPIAASLVIAIGLASWAAGRFEAPGGMQPDREGRSVAAAAGSAYSTGVGQRANLTLGDGTRVMLNTRSALRVAYTSGVRRVELVRGQAWFDVAKNPARPFVVAAAGREITALGTAFDVRIDRGRLEVMLIEGRVRVDQPGNAHNRNVAPSVAIAPSQLLVATPDRVDVSRIADPAPIESWRSGLLVFRDQPLGEAVAEFNRYAARPLRIVDDATATVRISGAFRAEDTRAFIGALEAGFGVEARSRDDAIWLTRR